MIVFFFKQKTAYEMRISDWSSDVCSSDLVNKTARLEDMEKGMVVQSGNDAAIALAEHVAGSEAAFAQLMNAYAKQLGLKNTHFVNATGLTADGHYSSARDLALLGRALARNFPEAYSYNKI